MLGSETCSYPMLCRYTIQRDTRECQARIAPALAGWQKEHHRVVSFEEEYRMFLQEYGVKYDER